MIMTTMELRRELGPGWGASLGQHKQILSLTDAAVDLQHIFDGLTNPYAFHDGCDLL